jgi:hypothetical protein
MGQKTTHTPALDQNRPIHKADIQALNSGHPVGNYNKLIENKIPLELQIIPKGTDRITNQQMMRGRWTYGFIMRYDGEIIQVSAKELKEAQGSLPEGIWWPIFLQWGIYPEESTDTNTKMGRDISNAVKHVPVQLQEKLKLYIIRQFLGTPADKPEDGTE